MRTKSSFLNFIVKLLSSIVLGILGIVLNNLVLINFGSDVNGLWGTIAQMLNLLTIFEGGLALSASVSLYKPYLENDTERISNILTATRNTYIRIGYIVTFIAVIASFFAPYFLESNVDRVVISMLFLIAAVNLSLNFFLVSKYNIMYAVAQKEYVNSFITMAFNVASQIISICAILSGKDIIFVKIIALIVLILRMPFVIKKHNKLFANVNFHSRIPDYSILRSVKDVLALQFAALIYGSTDMVVISSMLSTTYASVFLVYSMVYSFIKTFLTSLILAPFNAFGQLYAAGDIDTLSKNYKTYQLISIIAINIFITTANILIIHFVKLYTKEIMDINYVDFEFAMLLSVTYVLACIGDMLSITNSTGHFKEMKKISIFTALFNIGISVSLVHPFGIKGVAIGKIIAYLIHFSMQSFVVYKKVIKSKISFFIIALMTNAIVSVLLIKLSLVLNFEIASYVEFMMAGLITFLSVSILILIINLLTFKKSMQEIFRIFTSLVKKVV